MQRCPAEDTIRLGVVLAVSPLAVLEHRALKDDGRGLGHEDAADDEQQKLRLEQDGHGAERPAKRQ